MSASMKCDVCETIGRRKRGNCCPEGWLFAETLDDSGVVFVHTVCSQDCASRFWKPGPGNLQEGLQDIRDAWLRFWTLDELNFDYWLPEDWRWVQDSDSCWSAVHKLGGSIGVDKFGNVRLMGPDTPGHVVLKVIQASLDNGGWP